MDWELFDEWLAWLESRPAGYSRSHLWRVGDGRRRIDRVSPLLWLVQRWLEDCPGAGRLLLPDPYAARDYYVLQTADGQQHTYLPPRDMFRHFDLDEASLQALITLVSQKNSHKDYARALREALR